MKTAKIIIDTNKLSKEQKQEIKEWTKEQIKEYDTEGLTILYSEHFTYSAGFFHHSYSDPVKIGRAVITNPVIIIDLYHCYWRYKEVLLHELGHYLDFCKKVTTPKGLIAFNQIPKRVLEKTARTFAYNHKRARGEAI